MSVSNDLVHIWAKRSSSGGNSFMDFHGNKFNFLVQLQLKICLNLHIPSRENARLFCIDGVSNAVTHHHHHVACPVVDVAVPTSLLHAYRF